MAAPTNNPPDTQLINQSLKAIAAAMGQAAQNIANTFPNFQAAPATAASTGVPGQIAYDATHFYICVASNTWVRATLATF